jgi:hypothetical protein
LANIESFSYCGRSDFVKSNLGGILSLIMIIIRDLLTVLFEIMLNIYSIYYYRMFLKRKHQLAVAQVSSIILDQEENDRNKVKSQKITKSDVNLFLMTIYLSLLSVFFHLFTGIAFFFLLYYKTNVYVTYSLFLCCLTISCFKFFSNIFVFNSFNSKFQIELKKIFGIKN